MLIYYCNLKPTIDLEFFCFRSTTAAQAYSLWKAHLSISAALRPKFELVITIFVKNYK